MTQTEVMLVPSHFIRGVLFNSPRCVFQDTALCRYEIQRIVGTPKYSESLRNSHLLSLILTHRKKCMLEKPEKILVHAPSLSALAC
jgi:hypothetical protein